MIRSAMICAQASSGTEDADETDGEPEPGETRRRRLGEKLWALAMLEAWLRVFVDGRGRRPAGVSTP